MRRLLLVSVVLLLAGCDQAASRRPLVSEGGGPPENGLWALLEDGCAQPTNGAVQTWPDCATPVWVQPGEATTIVQKPVRARFVASDGEPRILQIEAGDAGEARFTYYAFRTDDRPPHRSARVWAIVCDAPAAEADGNPECLIEDERELRRLAGLAVGEAPLGRAIHIGPG